MPPKPTDFFPRFVPGPDGCRENPTVAFHNDDVSATREEHRSQTFTRLHEADRHITQTGSLQHEVFREGQVIEAAQPEEFQEAWCRMIRHRTGV